MLASVGVSASNTCPASAANTTPLVASQWSYATDPHGSTAVTHSDGLLANGTVSVTFNRVPRVDALNNSWVEIIYALPGATLAGTSQIQLEYQSSTDLVLKLSQKDYGGDGDGSYAHYQHPLPKSSEWTTQCVSIVHFQRPYWTPAQSKNVGIIKDHITAIYITPDLTDEQGGRAAIEIKSIGLLP
jgi:hypothetical protein